MEENKGIYIMFVILTLFVLGGFFLVFDSIGTVRNDMKNLQLSIEMNSKKDNVIIQQSTTTANESENKEQNTQEETQIKNEDVSISTAILFDTNSSPALQPQTKITIAVESVTKSSNETVTLFVKAYTSQATAYSALELNNIFQIITKEGENLKPAQINGQFESIPPKGMLSGSVVFNAKQQGDVLIFQMGSGDNAKFFEFNFLKKTYKETIVG